MSAPGTGQVRKATTAAAPLVFPCSTCGRSLKIRAALAGKSIRCPHCAGIMQAPANLPSAAPAVWRVLLPPFVLALVLWASFGMKLHNLDHTALTRWDEVHHAVVAQNVLKHPLKPTLVDDPYLSYDHRKWGENHIWLHKPILPFWQVALSFAVLGVNAFALRLPGAILSTGAALLTYLIGKELLTLTPNPSPGGRGETAGPIPASERGGAIGPLIAATLQAVSPFLMTVIHGYQFADNIDIALLFWVEAGIYFLVRGVRTGSWRDVLLAGVAQGLAFLCKSYLAGIVLGIGLAAWLLLLCRVCKREDSRFGPVRLLVMLGASVATVAPWLIHCMASYPDEFWHEHAQVWRHLSTNVEGWSAPWDRLVFDYLIAIYGVFYTPVIVAAIVLVGTTVKERRLGLWLLYAWGLGVLGPHLWAVTKTPSATVIGVPAFLLLFGQLVAEAWRGQRGPLAASSAILFMSIIMPAVVRNPGYGFPNSRAFGVLMGQSMWVIYHVTSALAIAAFLYVGALILSRWVERGSISARIGHGVMMVFCGCVLAWLMFQAIGAAWDVTGRDVNDPSSVEAGEFARENLPANAVLLCEERKGYEHLTVMFYADRTCYAHNRSTQDDIAGQIAEAGGIPYIVSRRTLPYDRVYQSDRNGPTVYLWKPPEPK